MTPLSTRTRGIIYGMTSAATFGLIPLFALPVIASGMADWSILVYRFGISAAAMGLLLLILKRPLVIPKKRIFNVIALAMTYALTSSLLLNAYHYINSGTATTIHFMYPVVVSLTMVLCFGERASKQTFFGIAIAVIGVVLLCSSHSSHSAPLYGFLFAGASVLTYAAFIVGVNQTRAREMDSLSLTFYVLLIGTLFFAVAALVQDGRIETITSKSVWLNLALLAIIPTLLSDWTLVLSIQHIGSTLTSVLGSMEPVTAVAVGALVFGETLSLGPVAGIVLILLAVILVIRSASKDKSAPLE